jgi:nitroreductase
MMEEITSRRSIRNYNEQPVNDEQISLLLESARLAPSGSNTQPWHFIVVKSKEMREKISAADHNQAWMAKAPVHIVCVADIRSRIKDDTEIILDENTPMEELKQIIRDTAIAAEHIILEAEDLGLASCWTAWFTQNDIRPVLDIPADKYVVCVITVGHSDISSKPAPRKSMDEIVHFEKW